MRSRRFASRATCSVLLGTALAGAGSALRAARGVPFAIGADEDRLRAVAETSPHAVDGVYTNTEAAAEIEAVSMTNIAARLLTRRGVGAPTGTIPVVRSAAPDVAADLAATWFGHSSVLVEIDGRRILADPIWSERASPSAWIGPRRLHPVPVALADLPPLDAVLISHDHYDHLDMPTVCALRELTTAPFVVPLGVGAHLRRWGVPAGRVHELDWDDEVEVAGLRLTCAEARHFSGRWLRRNTTQWSSWAISGPTRRAYFGGDTGYTAAFARAGERWGPFDLTILPVGAYDPAWPDIHMNPEESVRAHHDLRGGLLLPVHWATFNLAFHTWSAPVHRLLGAAERDGIALALPRPGERIDTATAPGRTDWWSAVE